LINGLNRSIFFDRRINSSYKEKRTTLTVVKIKQRAKEVWDEEKIKLAKKYVTVNISVNVIDL
jgi:hypothetical protein